MRLPDAIAPYASLVKWLLIVLLLAATFVGGCNHGKAKSAQVIADKDIALLKASGQLQDASNALNTVNAQTRFQQELAAAQARQAAAAVAQAERERNALRDRLGDIDSDIEAAKRDPDCRRALEAQVCAALF